MTSQLFANNYLKLSNFFAFFSNIKSKNWIKFNFPIIVLAKIKTHNFKDNIELSQQFT